MTELLNDIKTELLSMDLDNTNNDKDSLSSHFNYIQTELLPQLELALNKLAKGE